MTPPSAVSALTHHPALRRSREILLATDDEALDLQATICQIPAPSGAEARRAEFVARHLRGLRLEPVHLDGAGNVVARWGGTEGGAVVVAAHLDTVFGAEVDLTVHRNGSRLVGPGISDNARGLVGLLALARAVAEAGWDTERPVVFAATVGEEGEGDLRGARYLFGPDGVTAAAVIALDGAGLDRVMHRALGSRRFRVSYRGPGGHSWAAYGVPNPAHAVGRFVAGVAERPRPPKPSNACSVVRLHGGTGLNSIPAMAWAEVDTRSEDPRELDTIETTLRTLASEALETENRRRAGGTAPLELAVEMIGDRPAGATPRDDPLVCAAVDATRAIGREPELAAASTDANVPIALGIPAIALGAGGMAGNTHLPTEWYDNTGGPDGLFRALLVLAAAAGLR
ncbi:MAG: M20/M25/M40 family metallo-hydrolase [Gemmatimonadetes bacterium]|nr:M20/M25/M40 family metallo-hydrolase [Gemmatimonadota bacterium]